MKYKIVEGKHMEYFKKKYVGRIYDEDSIHHDLDIDQDGYLLFWENGKQCIAFRPDEYEIF